VGVCTRIEDSADEIPGGVAVPGFLDPVDEHALMVRLTEIDLKVVPGGFRTAQFLHISQAQVR